MCIRDRGWPWRGAARSNLHPCRGTVFGRPDEIPCQAGQQDDDKDGAKDFQASPVDALSRHCAIAIGTDVEFKKTA